MNLKYEHLCCFKTRLKCSRLQLKTLINSYENGCLICNEIILYGRETWSLKLRQNHKLRVFENKVLRRILGSKREEAAGE
jgi:hypothetical protein